MGNGNQAELEDRKDALAAGGRRARKELGMPVPNDRLRRKDQGGALDLDQHNHRSHYRNGRSRVYDDAQRAIIGIAAERMRVRHLDHGQQRQQGKTHRDQRQSSKLWPANPA